MLALCFNGICKQVLISVNAWDSAMRYVPTHNISVTVLENINSTFHAVCISLQRSCRMS